MADHTRIDYHCDATMAEKRAAMRNDRATTFHQMAQAEAGLNQGRWTRQNAAPVIGANAQYPRADLPAWVGADQAVEPPLGYAIDDHEPVGSPAEVEASIEQVRKREG
jgi:hypothetical protein